MLAGIVGAMIVGVWPQQYASAQLTPNDAEYNPPSRSKSEKLGSDYCNSLDTLGYDGIGDMIWITAMDGSTNITVQEGTPSVQVQVHAGGKFCSGFGSEGSGGTYRHVNGGRVFGYIDYPNTVRDTLFYRTGTATLDLAGLTSGQLRLEISVATSTFRPPKAVMDSPNAISTLNIVFTPRPRQWSINGQSYVNNITTNTGRRQGANAVTAKPGDRLDWSHDLRNTGPEAMDRDIYYNIDRSGYGSAWDTSKIPTGNARGTNNQLFVNIGSSAAQQTQMTVTQNDVGKTLCQRIAWRDRAWNTPGVWGLATNACARVPFNYNLTPTMTINPSSVIEPGEDRVSVDSQMRNSGVTKSKQVSSMITRMVIPRGTSLPSAVTTSTYGGGDITQAACDYFRGSVSSMKRCDVQTRNVVGHVFPESSTTQFPGGRYDDDISGLSLEVGDKLCYVASVNQYTASIPTTGWRHSVVRCAEVAKSPKVQIKGGNLYTGRKQATGGAAGAGDVTTSMTTKKIDGTTRVFGSWVEYGILASGDVDSASGAAIAGNNGADVAMQALTARNKLTFENRSTYGQYGDTGTMTNFRAVFDAPARNCGAVALASIRGPNRCTNALTLSGTVPVGSSAIIQASRITIDGDISYANGKVTDIKQLPQLVLIADEIIINGNVGRIDAWLVGDTRGGASKGFVVTCPDGKSGTWTPTSYVTGTRGLTDGVCNKQLQVNGPVGANRLFLRRTAGSDTGAQSGTPAEVFNMRADAYLWASQYGADGTQLTSSYTRDLSPRF